MIDQPSETAQSPVAEQPPVVEAPPAVRPPAPAEPMPLAEDPDALGSPAMAEPPAAVVPPSMVEEPPAVEPPPYLEEPAVATPPVPAAAEPPASDVAPVQSGSAPVLPAAGLEAIDRLVARGLPADLAEAVAEQAATSLMPFAADADPAQLVGEALGRRIPLAFLRRAGGVVGFVGTAGAGKTRCVARLAAAHAQHGNLPVAVVALRSPDGGAELTRLLAPYDVALHAVDSGAEGAGRIAELRGTGLVIVDTPGVSPRSPEELQALGTELEALAPDELHLAVPATVAPMVARELIGGVRGLGVDAIVITHADETEQLGTVVGLAVESGVPLSYIARGQAVDAGLRPATATELAAALAS